MKKDIINNNDSGIIILGEGRDEWKHRYFKFGIQSSDADIPPFSAQEILDSPNEVFGELTDAGANVFRKSVRNQLFQELDNLHSQPAAFKVVSRLGWNSGAFVLPHKNHRAARYRCRTVVPPPRPTSPWEVSDQGNAGTVAEQDWETLRG